MRRLIVWLLAAILRDEKRIVKLLEQILAQLTAGPKNLVVKGITMNVITGQGFTFTVTCFDGQTPPLPTNDTNGTPTVVATPSDTSVSALAPSATPGVYTGSGTAGPTLGALSLVASDGVLTSAAFTGITIVSNPLLVPTTLVVTAP